MVTPLKNLWHCFCCQVGGGPIDWVMKLRGISFRHAVELLKADPSLAAQGVHGPVKQTRVRSLPPPVAFDADDQALLAQTVGYYHETLKQSPEALAYLAARGLDHPELVGHFKLGYATARWACACRKRREKLAPRSARVWKGWASTERAGTSTSMVRWWCRYLLETVKSAKCMGARSPMACVRARRYTCICPVRTAACGMAPR